MKEAELLNMVGGFGRVTVETENYILMFMNILAEGYKLTGGPRC